MASLSEELLLLALDDEKGSVGMNASSSLDTALAGAQLLDLVMANRVSLEDGRIVVSDPSPTGDAVLDESLDRIAGDDKSRKPGAWIPKLTRGLRKRLLAELVRKGTVTADEKKFLGLLSHTRHPATRPWSRRCATGCAPPCSRTLLPTSGRPPWPP